MMLKLMSGLLYCLRWLAWAFHYLIIPASRPDPATEAVKTADNIKDGSHE